LPPEAAGETSLDTPNKTAEPDTVTALDPALPDPPDTAVGSEPSGPLDPFDPFDPRTEPAVSTDVDPEGKVQDKTSVVMTDGQSAAVAEKLKVIKHNKNM
jgi:hypothetical protein